MKIRVLMPYASSGFVIKHDLENEYALVDLGNAPDVSLEEQLKGWGISLENISLVALTHLHSDHAPPAGIRTITESADCPILLSQTGWEHQGDERVVEMKSLLEKSGRMELLDSAGEMECGNWSVSWRPLTHAVTGQPVFGGNTAFRINTVIVSGDGPIWELFTEDNKPFFYPAQGDPVRTMAVNIAHLSLEDLKLQDYPEERKKRWREEHGLLEDLLKTMVDPQFNDFYMNLKTLIPTHIRRRMREESAILYKNEIDKICAEQGFGLKVVFDV